MTALPPAGWFPDPDAGGTRWRWWDGYQWAPPGYGYAPAYDPVAHARAIRTAADTTRDTGKWFRGLMVAVAVGAFLAMVAIAVFGHAFKTSVHSGPDSDAHFFRLWFGAQAFIWPWNFTVWGYTALLIAWLYNAGKFADLQQWPARRSRVLGAFSVLIPILQFWWPYEAICDLYPPGTRPVGALRWFVWQLVTPIAIFLVVGITGFVAPTAVVAVVLVLCGAVLSVPVVLGWRLVDDLDAMQRAYLPAS